MHSRDGATPEGPRAQERFLVCGAAQSASVLHKVTALRPVSRRIDQHDARTGTRQRATSMAIDLVYPDPLSTTGLVSWLKTLSLLEALPEQQLIGFHNEFLPAAINHLRTDVRLLVNEELEKSSQDNKTRMALLGAAVSAEIKVVVVSKCGKVAYEVTGDMWQGRMAPVANPATMAMSGRLTVISDLRPHCALDIQLAGQPLFVAKNELQKLMKLKVGSPAARRQLAEQIIKHYLGQHKNQVMPKSQFHTEMRKSFPGAPKAALDRDRIAAMPAWRRHKGGRPKK